MRLLKKIVAWLKGDYDRAEEIIFGFAKKGKVSMNVFGFGICNPVCFLGFLIGYLGEYGYLGESSEVLNHVFIHLLICLVYISIVLIFVVPAFLYWDKISWKGFVKKVKGLPLGNKLYLSLFLPLISMYLLGLHIYLFDYWFCTRVIKYVFFPILYGFCGAELLVLMGFSMVFEERGWG